MRRRSETRVEALLDVESTTALTPAQKRRVIARAGASFGRSPRTSGASGATASSQPNGSSSRSARPCTSSVRAARRRRPQRRASVAWKGNGDARRPSVSAVHPRKACVRTAGARDRPRYAVPSLPRDPKGVSPYALARVTRCRCVPVGGRALPALRLGAAAHADRLPGRSEPPLAGRSTRRLRPRAAGTRRHRPHDGLLVSDRADQAGERDESLRPCLPLRRSRRVRPKRRPARHGGHADDLGDAVLGERRQGPELRADQLRRPAELRAVPSPADTRAGSTGIPSSGTSLSGTSRISASSSRRSTTTRAGRPRRRSTRSSTGRPTPASRPGTRGRS